MKTKTITENVKKIFTPSKSKAIQINITYLVVLFMLFLSSKKMMGQMQLPKLKGNIGVGLFGQISVNGYGTEYMPTIYYKTGRKTFFVAPTIQKQKANLSGIQITYQYSLTGAEIKGHEEGELELFVFFTAAYHHNAMLGKVTERDDQKANSLLAENGTLTYRYSSVEAFGGFGLSIPFLKRFKWTNSVGLGGYTSFNFSSQKYYHNQNLGLTLRTGITMNLNKHK
ncbi:MAG: hypothetical protein ABI448_14010 [Bacteroidia bacterium]